MKDNHYGPQLWCIYTALLIIASCQINGCIALVRSIEEIT